MATTGLVRIRSSQTAKETADALEHAVRAKGMTVFARIDHAAGAHEVGLSLRATEVLIFGNAKAGTPLMQAERTLGLDLPLKALVCEDASGATWITYTDPHWLAQRYGLGGQTAPFIAAMTATLDSVARRAARAA